MGQMVPIDVSGGLNDALPPTQIQNNECQTCLNVDYSDVSQGASRRGYTRFNTSRFQDASNRDFQVLGIYSFSNSPSQFRDIFVGLPASGAMELRHVTSNSNANKIAFDAGVTVGTNAHPFNFMQVRNILYGFNGDMMFSWNGDTDRDAMSYGIPAPTSTPSVSSGTGSLLDGVFKWFYTFYDSADGVESGPSPISAKLKLTGNGANVTHAASTNTRVDKIRIYRTQSHGQPPFFRTKEVTNATGTTTDNVADISVGVKSLVGASPPTNCRIGIPYNGVVYLMNNPSGTNYDRVYPSLPTKPEEFKVTEQFSLGFGDGQQITGAFVLRNQLIVFKERSIYHVTGSTNRDRNTQQINDSVGMKWPYAGVQVPEGIVFASEDGIYFYGAGEPPKKIENQQGIYPPQGTWDGSVKNLEGSNNIGDEVMAAYNRRREQFIWSYRTSANSGPNTEALVWNRRGSKAWAKYDYYGFDTAGEWRDNFSNVPTLMTATSDSNGFIYEVDVGGLDRIASGGTTNGTVSSGTTTTLTTGGTLTTTGDGLRDVYVWVKQDDTDVMQVQKIVSNTATIITVASWPSFTPASADEWGVGVIKSQVRTGRKTLGKPNLDKTVNRALLRIEEV